MRIRDIHIFTENLYDPYENRVSTGKAAYYDTLPFIDGSRFSGRGVLAGGFLSYYDGTPLEGDGMQFIDELDGSMTVKYSKVAVHFSEDRLKISADKSFKLEIRKGIDGKQSISAERTNEKTLLFRFNGFEYSILAKQGYFTDENTLLSESNKVKLIFNA